MGVPHKDMRVESRGWRRQPLTPILLALSISLLHAPGPAGAKELFDQNSAGIAIQGYDPVAYFTDGKAVRGSETFSYQWLGATWHFASAEHRDLFTADPARYAPQYGGYCTSGIVSGNIHSADPKVFRIVDGKLYLNGSQYELKILSAKGIEMKDAKWKELEAGLTE